MLTLGNLDTVKQILTDTFKITTKFIIIGILGMLCVLHGMQIITATSNNMITSILSLSKIEQDSIKIAIAAMALNTMVGGILIIIGCIVSTIALVKYNIS